MISETKLSGARKELWDGIYDKLHELRKEGMTSEQESDVLAELAGDLEDHLDNMDVQGLDEDDDDSDNVFPDS
jgi:hypothetical protein